MTDKQMENSQKDKFKQLLTVTSMILGFIPLSLVGYLILIARRDQAQLAIIMDFLVGNRSSDQRLDPISPYQLHAETHKCVQQVSGEHKE
jgi:hypothetical protein